MHAPNNVQCAIELHNCLKKTQVKREARMFEEIGHMAGPCWVRPYGTPPSQQVLSWHSIGKPESNM